MRIRRDRQGLPSSELNLQMRESWAGGEWMSLNNTMWTFFGVDFEQLLAWGVLRHEFNASSSNAADSDTTGGSVCLAIVSLLA